MEKRIYISADYSEYSSDTEVVKELTNWGKDRLHKVNFIDMSEVRSGSVSNDSDCRACDLKAEFNRQINASSAVIFIVGEKTALRKAGSYCERANLDQYLCSCAAYKQHWKGDLPCKVGMITLCGVNDDFGNVNSYSYLEHEFQQARKKNKKIIVLYNSLRKRPDWLPTYLKPYESIAEPFWIKNYYGNKTGNYQYVKKELKCD